MIIAGVWNIADYRKLGFEWNMAPTPAGKTRAPIGWWSMMAMTPGSK